MPTTIDRPPTELREQLLDLARLLAEDATLTTGEARREVGLDRDAPARPSDETAARPSAPREPAR